MEFRVFLDFGVVNSDNIGNSHLSFFARLIPAESFHDGYGKFDFLSIEKLLDPENGFLVDGKLELYCNVSQFFVLNFDTKYLITHFALITTLY